MAPEKLPYSNPVAQQYLHYLVVRTKLYPRVLQHPHLGNLKLPQVEQSKQLDFGKYRGCKVPTLK
jgi:hypothetical protein